MIDWLAELCDRHRLAEKWLIAESLQVAQQWKDRVNLRGCATVNLHSKSLFTIALALTENRLTLGQLSFAGHHSMRMILRGVFDRLLEEKKLSYFQSVPSTTGFSDLLTRSINDLRLAGVSPSQIEPGTFTSDAKAADLQIIYQRYCDRIREKSVVDLADCIDLAIEGIDDGSVTMPEDLILILPECFPVSHEEQRLLDKLASERKLLTSTEVDPNATAGSDLLEHVANAGDRFEYFNGFGEVNEVRGVFQRIVGDSSNVPFDDVEILHTDDRQYVPLILDSMTGWLAESGDTDDVADLDRLPVTFAQGIPCVYSRPGRALRGWMRWARHDFMQSRLVQLVREGLLVRPGDAEQIGYSRLASTLRGIPIGFQLPRYLPKLNQAIETAEKSREEYEAQGDVESGESAAQGPTRNFGLPTLLALRGILDPLIEIAPSTTDTVASTLQKAKQFLIRCVRVTSKLDRYSRSKLLDEIDGMMTALTWADDADLDPFAWLEELPVECRVLDSGPRPGRVHVSRLESGGQSGRTKLFVVGLDDARFPRRASVDPLLLDEERQALDSRLSTSDVIAERNQTSLHRVVERALRSTESRITFSFSVREMGEDRSRFPSATLLDFFRVSQSQNDADMEALREHCGAPVGFLGADHGSKHPQTPMSDTEANLAFLVGEPDEAKRRSWLHLNFDHAEICERLAIERAALSFGAADGYAPKAGAKLDPSFAELVSASRLETYGACPRRFFFRYGLEIRPPDEWEVDQDRWLDPIRYGNLVHELFEGFLRDLTSKGLVPQWDRDRKDLLARLHDLIDRCRSDTPIPNEDAFRRTRRDLRETCDIFLANEEAYCQENGARPWVLEASLGLGETESEIDRAEPIPLKLTDGRVIHGGGRLDRIDRLLVDGSERYAIWDYKSGSDFGYDQEDPFRQGRKLQPFLYMGMLRHRLDEMEKGGERVESFGYFFPGPRTNGRRIIWTRVQLRNGDEVLKNICDGISSGVFSATTEPDDCRFCDYQQVCGEPEFVASESLRKAASSCNEEVLRPIRQLRSIDTDSSELSEESPS